jgi:extracellular factor (EF) 3-hydroxypalmitic acid methyl ester biosynthesis protein
MSEVAAIDGVGIQTETALARVRDSAHRFTDLERRAIDRVASFHDVAQAVHQMCAAIREAELAGCERDQILETLAPARHIHGLSPFISRLQSWPRGYQGDYETIEYLLRQENRAAPDTAAYWLEFMALNSPIAQQHRNKLLTQSRELLRLVWIRPGAKILMIAAGGCPDVYAIKDQLVGRDFHLTISDVDPDAIATALERLAEIADRITAFAGNVFTRIRDIAHSGPFDLVLTGGLFDYLPHRQAVSLVRMIQQRLLAPGGRFLLTNVRNEQPYRVWIEYLANWRLIERTAAEVQALVDEACGRNVRYTVRTEPTGLTYLLSAERVQ